MWRTRDFVLALVTLVFLVTGFSATLLREYAPAPPTTPTVTLVAGGVTETEAVLPAGLEDNRATRLAELRQKIAAQPELFIFEGDTELASDESVDTEPVVAVLRCPNYQVFNRPWDVRLYTFQIADGARVLYQAAPAAPVTSTSSTSTAPLPTIVAEWPLVPSPAAAPQCLPTDVIGLTLGGSLIRASEGLRYQGLQANDLIGYALDGFPLYGPTTEPVDQCGGRLVAGQYRYQVSVTGDSLINCFTGFPVNL